MTGHAREPVLVAVANILRQRYPSAPALSILDAVFCRVDARERANVLDDFTSPWLELPTPFATLVAQAFDGNRAPFQSEGFAAEDPARQSAPTTAWCDVLKKLEARYRHRQPLDDEQH